MEVEPVAASQGGVRFSAAELARQIAADRKAAQLHDEGVQVTTASPNVTTSPTFSPSLYAQAAQFQLYTQSGTLAAMGQQGVTPKQEQPFHEHAEDIQAVDQASGNRVDTLA